MSDSPIIVALDYDSKQSALNFVDRINPVDCRLKVGKEMFTLFGPAFVEELQRKGFDVFLDLKFHDIPNTVAKAIKASAELGVWMVNVHASGGIRMMEAAKSALASFANPPKLIAVTVLTSMESGDLDALGIKLSPADYAEKLAKLAYDCELDGVVCSAQEAHRFKTLFGKQFSLVTPGIRPEGAEKGDQRRVMTPKEAVNAGVDYMVIGRPITQAEDPLLALQMIRQSLI